MSRRISSASLSIWWVAAEAWTPRMRALLTARSASRTAHLITRRHSNITREACWYNGRSLSIQRAELNDKIGGAYCRTGIFCKHNLCVCDIILGKCIFAFLAASVETTNQTKKYLCWIFAIDRKFSKMQKLNEHKNFLSYRIDTMAGPYWYNGRILISR